MNTASLQVKRFYVRNSLIDVEEDEYNEFKGHRSISVEDLPPWAFEPDTGKTTKKAVSRALASFLNSGRGGTVYLGIIDDGIVKGLFLTEYQKDHVIIAIKDLFSRYQPPVSEDKYKIEFVPIFGKDEDCRLFCEPNILSLERMQPHLLRTYEFCWCDKDFTKCIENGAHLQDYIIEILIFPQKSSFNLNKDDTFCIQLPLVYQNEEGKCFFRKSASSVEYSVNAIKDLSVQQVKEMYEPIVKSLREQIASSLTSH